MSDKNKAQGDAMQKALETIGKNLQRLADMQENARPIESRLAECKACEGTCGGHSGPDLNNPAWLKIFKSWVKNKIDKRVRKMCDPILKNIDDISDELDDLNDDVCDLRDDVIKGDAVIKTAVEAILKEICSATGHDEIDVHSLVQVHFDAAEEAADEFDGNDDDEDD